MSENENENESENDRENENESENESENEKNDLKIVGICWNLKTEIEYEFRLSAATGCFRHGVSLHTSIVVKVDRGPHDSFLQPNRVHRHVERVITIFLCTWTVFIRRHLGGQPRAHFHLARMQRPDNDTISRDHRQ